MNPAAAKRLRLLFSVVSILTLIALAFGAWFYRHVRQSLPKLDGQTTLRGLTGKVTIDRDALGVPTIHAGSRTDSARALGFLHGQDRFFEMDVFRRRPAGELAELVGEKAVGIDKRARLHGFRSLSRTVLSRLPAEQREQLLAYTEGVNAGLTQLEAAPFEYALLRVSPQLWKAEDCVLLVYAMTMDLQDSEGEYERSLAALRDTLGNAALAFFAPLVGPNDAALDGSKAPLSPIPGPRAIDLRKSSAALPNHRETHLAQNREREFVPGSNGFALSGARTAAAGSALLASDMHLGLRVPNIWYRTSLVYPSPDGTGVVHVTGVTLPGTPFVIAGSNGHIAWGFTDAYVDVSDVVLIEPSKIDPSVYGRGPDLLQIENRKETIKVKGGDPLTIDAPWTVWGPIIGKNYRERSLAYKWVAHDPDATNFALNDLAMALTVQDAIKIAHRAGIPAQNFIVADGQGTIGWTVCGKIPKRVGFDGRLPVSWAFGDRHWDGYYSPEEVPTVIAPANGQIWSANQRMLDAEALLKLGDGGYARPERAARIRDDLTNLPKSTEGDLLGVQLDDHAPHLDRWHGLLLMVLNDQVIAQKKARAQLREAATPWEGRASVESVSYRLVREFQNAVSERVLAPIFEPCVNAYEDFNFHKFNYEPALWQLVQEKPAHMLNPNFVTWDDLLIAAADDVIKTLAKEKVPIAHATWGQHNIVQIRHPLSPSLPDFLASWLDMPASQLPGDIGVPRVQTQDHGASARFVVAPGHEAQGIFHMPGGQSGNPLSPFYRAGHEAWARGEVTPFLPGPPVHSIVLIP